MLGLIAVVGAGYGSYEAYWAIAGHNADHQSHINRQQYGNQQTLRDQVTKNFGDFNDISVQILQNPGMSHQLEVQRLAILNILCQNANEVTGDSLPTNQAAFISTNCLDGQANPNSTYAQIGN
jgi:hypothetical protein